MLDIREMVRRFRLGERDFTGSYTTVLRFVQKLEKKEPDKFLRVEVAPGEEAQVDFGYVGLQFDPLTQMHRRAWVFVMTLSFSRHQYAEIVFDQSVETFVALHVRAFEWFGGVPRRIVIDNLKAGITRAVLFDSEAQRSYREAAEHCRPSLFEDRAHWPAPDAESAEPARADTADSQGCIHSQHK